MIDSTRSAAVVSERPAWTAELVVQRDRRGKGQQPLQDALSEAGERSGAVTLEGQRALAGPEDRLDALADRSEVRASAGLVSAAGPEDRGVPIADGPFKSAAGRAPVRGQRLAARSAARGRQRPVGPRPLAV